MNPIKPTPSSQVSNPPLNSSQSQTIITNIINDWTSVKRTLILKRVRYGVKLEDGFYRYNRMIIVT